MVESPSCQSQVSGDGLAPQEGEVAYVRNPPRIPLNCRKICLGISPKNGGKIQAGEWFFQQYWSKAGLFILKTHGNLLISAGSKDGRSEDAIWRGACFIFFTRRWWHECRTTISYILPESNTSPPENGWLGDDRFLLGPRPSHPGRFFSGAGFLNEKDPTESIYS